MIIQRLSEGDAFLLARVIDALVPEEERGRTVPSSQHLARALRQNHCYFFAALRAEEPLGFLSAYRFPDVEREGAVVYLYNLIVAQHARRRGVATALVEALRTACSADGVHLIWAGTDAANVAARRTFERTGAKEGGTAYVEYLYTLTQR